MTINVGEKIPNVAMKCISTSTALEDIQTAEYFANRKVVLFGIPGAFTPICTNQQLPNYMSNLQRLQNDGIDQVVCLAVNDPFVLGAWAEHYGALGLIEFLADGNATFTKALGLDVDLSASGLGLRSKRYAMVINNGIVEKLEVEDNPGEYSRCMAERMV